MGEPIRFWLVYRVECPNDANRWSCFADESNARSICAAANKAWGDGTWAVRDATLGSDAAAYRRGLTDAAGICAAEAARYASAFAGSHGAEDDTAATMAHALATAIRRAAGGQ